jgi:uncharacterized membrane protein
MDQFNIAAIIFAFFVLGVVGWLLESVQESIVRRHRVNKGFFKGPFVPCQGIGGLGVYLIGSPFKEHPVLLFFAGILVCTLIEYITALFLEKFFKVKCWDYTTYPHTRWCHFQGRIALTISLFFGVITLFVVYRFWEIIMNIVAILGNYLWLTDCILIMLFVIDATWTITRLYKLQKAGIIIKGFAVFGLTSKNEK